MRPAVAQPELDARDDGEAPRASAREEQLEQLTFECLERIESEGPQVLEELCRAQPALAAELLERIHALLQRGLVDVGWIDVGGAAALAVRDAQAPPAPSAPRMPQAAPPARVEGAPVQPPPAP